MSETDDQAQRVPDDTPEADAAEQRAALDGTEDRPDTAPRVSMDADEADTAEQSREVPIDEDDYR
ncbi:hypothetical protein [Actinomadura algeriensis]|uniref:Nucleotide exchange factor GrpE n=1 Tax=Actinomadura algeriensis TaxID=1679523 RepID=A0ABR9JVD5_9ACTN|nr:hypothetical protein [Actinomadura algeriensis]MBE1534363.1 hypothetical protein [Actinomadura algeriensis]